MGQAGSIVGRDDELAVLDSRFARIAGGDGCALLVTGEPGVGKTSVVQASAGRWQDQGALVLAGACQQYGADELAYAPFVTAWAHVELDGDRGFGVLLAELARMGDLPAEVARAWLFDRVAQQLSRLAADHPVVLLLEDLHWADRGTLTLLRFLAASLRGRRVLLLCTARSDGAGNLGAADDLTELVGSGPLEHLALHPLTATAAGLLVRTALGPGADHGAVDDVVTRSGGNPYLAHELAVAARAGVVGLPGTLRRVLQGRIDANGPGAGTVVATVALAAAAPLHVLDAAIVGVAGRDGADLVRALVESGMLVTGGGSDGLHLRHALLGDVAAAGLSATELRHVHRAVAVAWGPDPASSRHWEAAGEPGRALAAWVAGGRRATAAGAYGAAAHAYTRAVELAARPDVGMDVGRDRLAVEAADALHRVGDDDPAVDLLRATLATGQISDPTGRLALLDRLQGCLFAAGRAPDAFAVLAEAASLVPGSPPSRESARIVAADGSRLMILGRFGEGAERSLAAASLAAELSADDTLAYAWTTEGVCRAATGDLPRGRALLVDAGRLAGGCGAVAVEARTAVNLGYVLANVGQYQACVHAGREALARLATQSLAHTLGATIYHNTVVALVALGAWDDALAMCAEAEAAPVPATTRCFLALSRARVAALRGESQAADAALVSAEQGRPPQEPAFTLEHALVTVQTLRLRRRHHEALSLVRSALRSAPGGIENLRLCAEGLRTLADLEEAGGRVRRVDGPEQVRRELCAATERDDTAWGTVSPEVAALRLLCAAEVARLDDPRASGWEAVAESWEVIGLRHDAAYARLRQAEALLAARAGRAATEPLRAAYQLAMDLGARPLVATMEAVARRARIPLPGGPSTPRPRAGDDGAAARGSPGTPVDLLTAREREVLALLGLGRTNRQISRQLVISERTAAVHVSNLLAKLGAGNRIEAVRIAHRLRS